MEFDNWPHHQGSSDADTVFGSGEWFSFSSLWKGSDLLGGMSYVVIPAGTEGWKGSPSDGYPSAFVYVQWSPVWETDPSSARWKHWTATAPSLATTGCAVNLA